MATWPLDLSASRILITNDDGIHAPGLKILKAIADSLSDDVWVVAPDSEQSGVGHALTLRRPLRLQQQHVVPVYQQGYARKCLSASSSVSACTRSRPFHPSSRVIALTHFDSVTSLTFSLCAPR